ncbi:translation initiation factor IF-2-like [Falco peregrinus]|uniref:translation initiation factor IF-2-like n=1 Tax=Falco peregrinus TaxID=8954 RepID=UPI00247A7002|nr:translation initiation factor IF-2-like [Falco peregrinus]
MSRLLRPRGRYQQGRRRGEGQGRPRAPPSPRLRGVGRPMRRQGTSPGAAGSTWRAGGGHPGSRHLRPAGGKPRPAPGDLPTGAPPARHGTHRRAGSSGTAGGSGEARHGSSTHRRAGGSGEARHGSALSGGRGAPARRRAPGRLGTARLGTQRRAGGSGEGRLGTARHGSALSGGPGRGGFSAGAGGGRDALWAPPLAAGRASLRGCQGGAPWDPSPPPPRAAPCHSGPPPRPVRGPPWSRGVRVAGASAVPRGTGTGPPPRAVQPVPTLRGGWVMRGAWGQRAGTFGPWSQTPSTHSSRGELSREGKPPAHPSSPPLPPPAALLSLSPG